MACEHRAVLTKRRFGLLESYVYQCEKCGKRVGPRVSVKALTPGQVSGIRLWNPQLRRRGSGTARSRRYQAYMRSPEWKRLRQAILERDGFECLLCGEAATEAHHLSYDRFGQERETDLIAVCRECNQAEREKSVFHRMMGTHNLKGS